MRDFVSNEVRSVAIHPDRLQPFEKPLLVDLLHEASRMGLRTLALSEAAGGAGVDTLTPGFLYDSGWDGLFAPAKTSAAVVNRLHAEAAKAAVE